MARLIPQKQIEEINSFRDSISVANSVFISGSLLVSQSVDLGSQSDTPQRITGSVQITGSLELDGNLSFKDARDRLDATASFADTSVDTQRFGGILAKDFGASGATIYVSATKGDDNNDGRTPQFPLRTIKKAAELATPGDDGRYGLPTGSLFTGFRIDVDTGTYLEENPIELPKNTTVWGSGLRVTKILAKNENEDLFWVNSGCYLAEMTFGNLRVFPNVDNSQTGFAVAFAPNAFITTSPYVQNCSMISNQENSFLELYEDIPPGGGGLNVDGNKIHPDSPLASMVLDAYTQVAPNGVGCQVVGRGFIQLVSFFTNYSAYSVKVLDGGQAVLLNSNTSFGDFGMFASGSRFITGSGGNVDAFNTVRDNYSIIIDTIEDGLSAIPDLVPNTAGRVKVTDEEQYILQVGNAYTDEAEKIKSEYNLVTSIVDAGNGDLTPLFAKSNTSGYDADSVFNVSGDSQFTSSITASSDDIASIDTNFDIIVDVLERGNPATSSYQKQSNVSESIKISDTSIYSLGSSISSYNIDVVGDRFDTILSIVEGGVSLKPTIVNNAESASKFGDVAQYGTDVSSSAEVATKVSQSFSIVYDILANGTGSAPTIIQSGSENLLVDYQNGFALLKNNIDFIKEETITYLSASWSEFEYNQETCKRDIGYIVSGAAHDLLYGGNEESVRNGLFYYLYPSEATTTQKDPTLTAIKYVSDIAQKLLGDTEFGDSPTDNDNGYDVIFNNKEFIRDETIAYVSSSWYDFDYNEAKCRRDIGYILDAVATDLKWGGNERSVVAGEFYYKYPSQAIINGRNSGQLQQTLDGIRYAKRITEKLLGNETFVTASESRRGAADLIRENRSLIQNETITYINTTYPNFSYNEASCSRDTGYIVDAITTDMLYGGNERSELAGIYYNRYPSEVNGVQLDETIDAIRYAEGFTKQIALSNLIPIPQVVLNTAAGVRVTSFEPTTGSISATQSEVNSVSHSFGIIEDIIRYGEDSTLAAIGMNSDDFQWDGRHPLNVTSTNQITSSEELSSTITSINASWDLVNNIIENGTGSLPVTTGSYEGLIKVTDTQQYINTSSVATSTEATAISESISIVSQIVQNGTGSLPSLVENTDGLIKVGSISQFTTSSVSASIDDISFISESFAIVARIIEFGTGSYQTASLYGDRIVSSSTIAAYDLIKENIDFIQEETIAYLSSSWSTFEYNESKCRRDVGLITSGAAEDLIHNVYSSSIVNGKFYLEYPSEATGSQLNQTLDGIRYASRLAQNLASNNTFVSPSQAVLDTKDVLFNNKSFVQNEVIGFISSSWSEFEYNETTCKRDVGYIIDAAITDIVYGGNERSRIAAEFYYKYPSAAIVGGVPSLTQQKDPTVDGINYAAGLSEQIVLGNTFVTASADNLSAKNLILNNKSYLQQQTIDYVNDTYPKLQYRQDKCYRDTGFIIDAVVTDLVYGGNARSLQAGIFYYKFPSKAIDSQKNETTDSLEFTKNLSNLILLGTKPVEDGFDTVIKIIESGSSIISEETVGTDSKGNPISTVGIPKNSYGDNLIQTVVGTTLPDGISVVENASAGIKFGTDTQYTASINASSAEISKVSSSFSTIIDIIEYGVTSSLELSGSYDTSTYYEIISLPGEDGYFFFNQNQLQYFDGREGWRLGAEDTGSFEGSIKDPTLTFKRGEMYTLSVNDLGQETNVISEPFWIKTKRVAGKNFAYNDGVTNNGITFGTITFIVPFDAPDYLYYVNEGDVSASGQINIVDELPLSDTQRYVEIPSKGQVEVVANTVDNIKRSGVTQFTSSISSSIDESNSISSSYATVIDILTNGLDVKPSVTNNIDGLVKKSSLSQYTSSVDSTVGIRNRVTSSFDIVLDIVENGLDVVPSLTQNIDDLIKVTSTSQFTSSLSGSNTEVDFVSSSYAIVLDILGSGTGSLPTEISNANSNIKFYSTEQFTGSLSGSLEDIDFVSSSISIVTEIISNGSGSYLTASNYVTPSTNPSTVAAYEIIKENISFIQNETIAYLSSSWSTASYNEASCSRDVGLIVSGAAEDLLFGVASASIVNGKFYLEYPSQAETSQLNQTLDGIFYASKITQELIQNNIFVTASTEVSASYNLIRENREFIKDETIAYLSSSWSTFDYNETTCKRDVGHIIDAVSTDLLYGGNERSINAGVFYYKYPSEATSSQLDQTKDGINYARRLTEKIVNGDVFAAAPFSRTNGYDLIFQNKDFIAKEVTEYISSSWADFEYNDVTCRRDVGYILDAVATDLLYGGNERSRVAGEFYYLYPSDATGSQLLQTLDGIKWAKGMVDNVLQNNIFQTASNQTLGVAEVIVENKELIKDEVITYLSSSWSTFEYNEAKCRRDTGYIIDAVVTDFVYGGNERAVNAGEFYYLYPSDATGSQLTQTVDGVTYAQRLTDKLINDVQLVTASLERQAAYDILFQNKSMIQNEVISFISASWSEFEYIESKCRRDTGYIIDAVATDMLYGGNERSVTAGEFYYLYPSEATTTQKDQTITGINHAARLYTGKLLNNILLQSPNINIRNAYDLIVSNRGLVQDNVIEFVDALYPYFTYNRVKCRRDTGYIIDAVATDLLWGGNERSVIAGDYYYRFPSEATTIQIDETVDALRYAKAFVKNIILNNVIERPSIITNTENNIRFTNTEQYSGSMAISGSNLELISSSFTTVIDTIRYGLGELPTEIRNVESFTKVTDAIQVTQSYSGSETQIGIISASIDMINDIITLGSDNIPFTIAKYFQTSELDTPQQLTTSSYVAISGDYSVSDELNIVSSSFAQINDIITNGTGSLPTLVTNVENNVRVTNETQYTSNVTGSSVEITIVSSSAALIENIVQNGTSVIPTIVQSNTDIDNLIKVGDVPQYISASSGDKLQSKIVSSSFGIVIDILTNGTGSAPEIVDYENAGNAEKTLISYELLKNNIEFIKEETILFMSSSWSTFVYDESKCRRDVGLIVSGAAEDLLFNANSASVVNGKFYYEYPSQATGSQLDQTVTALRYASNLAQNIIRNRTYVSPSAEVSASYDLLFANKDFIKEETIAFVSSSWSDFSYNETTCKRDVGYIVDAVATDLLYGGNERSVTAGRYYYDYPSAAIVGGVPNENQQKDPTVTAINYVKGLAIELVGGATFQTASNEVEYVYDSIRTNREFIQNETIAFVNAKYPNLEYNEASCSRDTGFIIDAVATDLRYGGNQRALTAGEFYYRFPSKATNVQLGETTDAIVYASDLVREIVLKNTLSIPTITSNVENNIKVGNIPQYISSSASGSIENINFVSSSIDIVTTIIANGTGSYETASNYITPSTDESTIAAYQILRENIPFIQEETIAYLSSSWSTFDYNESKCRRDVGLIISGAAEDLIWNVASASIVNGKFYYEYPSQATGSQLNQTLDGIFYASRIAQKLIQNIEFVSASAEASHSYNLIRDNRLFIQSESIAYLSSSWSDFDYNQETCKRDIGHIIDAVSTDILYGGNERSVIAGDFYYKYPSSATTTQLFPTTTGIGYAGDIMESVIVNNVFETASADRIAGNKTLLENRSFIQNEVIAYISSSWSNFEYNEASCSRDTGFIVDAAATDLLYGGNQRSREAGDFYFRYPSSATVAGNESPNVNAQLYPTIDGIRHAGRLSNKLVQNIEFVTASNEVSASWNLLRDNKEFIQNEVIAYVSSSWSGVYYNEDKCKRDVGYLIDAAATDLYYGGNERSVNGGQFYWRFPSRATNKGVPSEQNQLDPTIDGIRYANGLSQRVIQNLPFSEPSASVLVASDLLLNNKTLIQRETIEFLSSSWSEFEYNDVSCSRDIGYIIDAVRTDLVYGGNERAIKAGEFYYYIPSVATTEQKPQTIDGIDFAKGMSENVVLQKQLVAPSFNGRRGSNTLRGAKKTLQSAAISYTNAAFPNFTYNEEKCYRDTGFIVDAIATDILYGGNQRSIKAAESYYTGVYGSAAVVINEQKKETAETNRYLRTLFKKYARNAPVELFGSLIITTGHDFSYAGSGVTYKALPPNQGGNGIPDPTKEVVELGGGRVFFTSGNELGDFRIGAGLVINQATGTLQGRTFSRSLFSLVTPFSLALQD